MENREVFEVANEMEQMVKERGCNEILKSKVLGNCFYEPSTRTSSSFQAAMLRLGGKVVPMNESSSSVTKGETLSDTVRCLECYCDVLVLRHPVKGSAKEAADAALIPVINAGDGVGEHPTQALLDLYTIHKELGGIESKVITMVGDLKNGRTVHSLAKILSLYNVKLNYVSPSSLRMPDYVKEVVASRGIKQDEYTELDSVLAESDVLYVTRVQKERFPTAEEYNAVKDAFIITPDTLKKAKSSLAILHPLPRVNEIQSSVDSDPRAAYFRQMRNGLYVRMAILSLVLLGSKKGEGERRSAMVPH